MMIKKHRIAGLAVAVIVGVIASISVVAPTWAHDDEKGAGAETRLQQRDEWFQMRLKKMGERLEIKASQQDGWQEYVTAYKAVFEGRRSVPAAGGDAAAGVRARAEHATEFAGKLTKLADATAQLEKTLTPAQRQTLDQLSESAHHRGDHCGHGPGRDREHVSGLGHDHPQDHGGPGMR
jgi:hypothetical protein